MKIICSSCNYVNSFKNPDFLFDAVEEQKRGMDKEITHSATVELKCKKCKKQINLIANIYEYPIGVYNDKSFDINGGKLEEEPDLTKYIPEIISNK